MVIEGIQQLLSGPEAQFRISEPEQVCSGASRDMVRHVLREQQEQGFVTCTGRGAGDTWSRGKDTDQGNA